MTVDREALRPPRLYAVADAEAIGPGRLVAAVEALAGAGIQWIQLRGKHLDGRALAAWAGAARRILDRHDGVLWINDRADLAAAVPAGGLHLGQHDLPPSLARPIVGPCCWLGRSTHTEQQVVAAAADPAVDVVAVGPVFTTTSKRDAEPVVGLDLVRFARHETEKPIVAIGGIDASRARSVLDAGADTVALLGALCHGDIVANVRRVQTLVGERR